MDFPSGLIALVTSAWHAYSGKEAQETPASAFPLWILMSTTEKRW